MIHPLLRNGRFLFTVNGCSMCAIWKAVIDSFNMELKVEKQIVVINCSEYYDFGISPTPVFDLFKPYIQGHYPMLFLEGAFKYGAGTTDEVLDWISSRLDKDFIFRKHNKYLHNKDCRYIESGKLKGQIICN